MANKRTLARNVLWNWSGMAARMGVGFVIAPFLVRHLGQSGYGLWLLIASLTGYFSLLDLGVRGSVGRNIAFHQAKKDFDSVNGILNTSLAILLGVAGVAALATFAVVPLFFYLFDVPPEFDGDTRLALIIVCINLALTFPFSVFDATLWAFQRFDIINAIDIPAVFLQALLTFVCIRSGQGVLAMAWITLITTLVCSLPKIYWSFRLEPGLHLGTRYIGRSAASSLFGYSVWYFLLSMTRMITPQIGPQVIGAKLAVDLVTPFGVVNRLLSYATSIMVAATGVLTPHMTSLHAEERHEEQVQLFLQGGKYCLALSLFFLLFFLFLGQPFLTLWMGPRLEYPALLLVILTLGETLPMAQWVSHGMILGMNRHKPMALMNLGECLSSIVLALLLVGPYGILGVAMAVAAPGILCREVLNFNIGHKFRA